MDGYIAVAIAQSMRHRRRRARTRPRRQRIARAAFPNLDFDIVSIDNLQKLDIRPVGEARSHILQNRPDFMRELRRSLIDDDNAMRIADRRAAIAVCLSVDFDGFVDDLAPLARDWDFLGIEADVTHSDGDKIPALRD